jgi:hypothetical protein
MANVMEIKNDLLDAIALMAMNFDGKMFYRQRLVNVGELFYGSIFAEIAAGIAPSDPVGFALRKFINKTVVVRTSNEHFHFKNGAISAIIGNPSRFETFGDTIDLRWEIRNPADGSTILHRLDGPALVQYTGGGIAREEWYIDGVATRLDGPAKVFYQPNGAIRRTEFLRNGMYHRVKGPAIFDQDSRRTYRAFYLNGELIGDVESEIPVQIVEDVEEVIDDDDFVDDNDENFDADDEFDEEDRYE